MTPTLLADRHLVRESGGSRRYVVARIAAPPPVAGRSRPRADVAFVLDRSGSMSGEKMAHAQAAVVEAIGRLEPSDHFSVVAYDEIVDVIAAHAPATEVNRAKAVRRVRSLRARGGTNLHAGWMEGAEGVVATLDPQAVGRCLLVTDGLANHGVTDPETLTHLARDLRARGVSTSTFGIGADFDEGLLGRIADTGGGTFRFIERSADIVRFVQDELGEALDVDEDVAGDHVELPEGARLEVIGPWDTTHDGRAARIALPDLVARQTLELLFEVHFPAGRRGTTGAVRLALESRERTLGIGSTAVDFRYAPDGAVATQPRDREIDRLVAERFAGAAAGPPALARRDGDVTGAALALHRVAERIAGYASGDAALEALVSSLRHDVHRLEGAMDGLALKRMHFEASAVRRNKQADGRARRGPAPGG